MKWDDVKQQIDDAIAEEICVGEDSRDVEIDWIDISMDEITSIEIINNNGVMALRVT
jgi:hypothetical protein